MATRERIPGFWGRLRFYLVGVGIGLVLLGTFQMAKRNELAKRNAEAERARQLQSQPGGLFPPLPEANPPPPPSQPR